MPKERNFNPVQAQRKADKTRAVKKGAPPESPTQRGSSGERTDTDEQTGKAEIQERRNEKLARKNPERIQKQIDDLKAVTSKGGKLSRHEEQVLEGLEKEFKAVTRAREALGERAPAFGSGRYDNESRPGVLGKRPRGSRDASSSSDEEVDEETRNIPMPRDTPPPIPKEVLDQWYARRRARRNMDGNGAEMRQEAGVDRGAGQEVGRDSETSTAAQGQAAATITAGPKTVYEAKPVMRDLRKEAVTAFVPASVQAKMMRGRGRGGLMEPEEADQLEKQGYLQAPAEAKEQQEPKQQAEKVTVEDVDDAET